ncbi:hypothetical protein ACFC09_06050 [Streptomyces sp. NPDC056161]|uniref:hypothetical protein n=1 Tax=Streptomyces sp. NPDC056161 TaxID=3345732 RepID=UPI0035DD1417
MNVKSRAFAGAVVGAAALGLSVMAPVASADPAPGVYRVLAGVGSDTTEDVLSGLGNDVDGGSLIASYDATIYGSAKIKTRAAGCEIDRPNDSSAGITALNNDIDSKTGCLDFARSSRGPQNWGPNLTWIPFATDKLTMAVRQDSLLNDSDGLDLTVTQLRSIYACTLTQLNHTTLEPKLPPSGSGLRTVFLNMIGNPTLGSCVGTTQASDGKALDTVGDIAPYSVAKWISQTRGLIEDLHGDTVLGTIDGGQYSFPVYNVVSTAKLTDPTIAATFVGSGSKVCQATATITRFSFGTASDCGDVFLKGEN